MAVSSAALGQLFRVLATQAGQVAQVIAFARGERLGGLQGLLAGGGEQEAKCWQVHGLDSSRISDL